jgi:hypothetical protein
MRAWLLLAAVPGCFFGNHDEARCPIDRSMTFGLQQDVVAFGGCKRASGIVVRTGATIDLAPLRELQEITGDLSIGPTVGVDEVLLNDLRRVGGTIYVASNGSMQGLFLPRLEHAGRIDVEANSGLTTISMPRLETVEGALVIDDNHGLELIAAPSLASVKELVITHQPKLSLVEMGKLTSAESVRIEDDPKLAPEVIDALRAKASTR